MSRRCAAPPGVPLRQRQRDREREREREKERERERESFLLLGRERKGFNLTNSLLSQKGWLILLWFVFLVHPNSESQFILTQI